ncbi:MAG: ATP synthase F0 subunit B [Clostridiales bacterium]|nr:ATP synthase F0 subunit B [Candidatus Cacconaster stercorequi]
MSINVSEVIWTIICFFVLLFVLKKFLFDPLITFMDARKARVEAGMVEGREAQRKKEENENALRESWKNRSIEAKELLAAGKAADEKERAKVLSQAQAEAAQTMRDARERVNEEGESARHEVNEQMDELVTVLAQQLLQNEAK